MSKKELSILVERQTALLVELVARVTVLEARANSVITRPKPINANLGSNSTPNVWLMHDQG